MSAKVSVAPSASRTRRPCQCHQTGAPSVTSSPLWRARVEIIDSGSRARAWQKALVLVLRGGNLAMARWTAWSASAWRQLPSAESAWVMNIAKVSVGGKARSRWAGTNAAT